VAHGTNALPFTMETLGGLDDTDLEFTFEDSILPQVYEHMDGEKDY
jgi:hypothetical protein